MNWKKKMSKLFLSQLINYFFIKIFNEYLLIQNYFILDYLMIQIDLINKKHKKLFELYHIKIFDYILILT